MKKTLYVLLFVTAMLISLVGTASAAPMKSGTVTLAGVDYVPGKGPVFTFNVSGHFSKSELKGSLQVSGGADFDLHCTQVDDTTVKCTTSKKVAGANVMVTWGGSTFWTSVPGAPDATEYCYNIYDYDFNDVWQSFGTYCQESEAEYGDMITWFNPYYNHSYDYEFWWEGPEGTDIIEDAYYYWD
jgi:hypothetical protein